MFGLAPGVRGMNITGFKATIPAFNGKQESFSGWKQESVIYSRRYDFDPVFAKKGEPVLRHKRSKPKLPDGKVAGQVRGEYCCFAFECLAVFVVNSQIRKGPGYPFSGSFPGGRMAMFG